MFSMFRKLDSRRGEDTRDQSREASRSVISTTSSAEEKQARKKSADEKLTESIKCTF